MIRVSVKSKSKMRFRPVAACRLVLEGRETDGEDASGAGRLLLIVGGEDRTCSRPMSGLAPALVAPGLQIATKLGRE